MMEQYNIENMNNWAWHNGYNFYVTFLCKTMYPENERKHQLKAIIAFVDYVVAAI